MSDNYREFDIGIKDFGDKEVPEAVRDFRDGLALEGLRSMVMLTPVKTGRAKGNHQTTVGEPAEGFDEDKFDKNGSATIAAGATVIAGARDPYDPIWIHNGVPYIEYINDGTEKVAAVRMLERTVARLERIAASR